MAYSPRNANGQATMANSEPVVIASDQSPINVSGDVASAATDSGNPVKIGGKYSSTKPTYTDGQRGNVNIDTRGNQTVSMYVPDSQNPANFKADNADAVAVSATADKLGVASRNTVFNGTTWDRMPGDTTGVKVQSHQVTNAGTFAVQESGSHVQADDAAFTPATSKVMMAGFEADESSTDSVDEGDGGAARMTLDRKQIVTLQPHTAGGLSTFMASGSDGSSILVATAQAVKASAGQLYGYYAYNPEAAVTFVHFYNTAAASVTVGTTNPLFTIAIPAGSAANLSIPQGITFSNAGWSVAATTTAGGSTAPATGVSLVAWYM